jgi:PIN domain nuclease of toxin-antitoxin system
MQTLLDTHAWLWWVTEDRRLSKPAGEVIGTALGENTLYLSFISVWEIAKKVEKGQLVLDRPIDEWVDLATIRDGLHMAELTRPILVESCRLPGDFHGDPADQMIVATARQSGAVLVTKDRAIRAYEHVRCVW